jgi:predicted transcriptional regulator YheO
MPTSPVPEPLFRHDWREQINLEIRDFLTVNSTSLRALDRHDRIALLGILDAKGLFEARNATPFIAQSLGISRASVYGLLAAPRGDKGDARPKKGARKS